MSKRFYVDTETTGTDYRVHGIHQISGIIEIDGVIKEKFDFKLKPFDGCLIDQDALDKCNVKLEDILQYPDEHEVYNFLSLIIYRYINKFDKTDKFLFVAYNANFDNQFLQQFWYRNKDEFYNSLFYGNILDVMVIATEYFEPIRGEFENFKLMTVAKQLGIVIEEEKLHNAVYDIEITIDVLIAINNKRRENLILELSKTYYMELKPYDKDLIN